jgi:cell division septal protein FtsQ
MWYRDNDNYSRGGLFGHRRENRRNSILMVSARMSDRRKERVHRVGTILLVTVVLAGIGWAVLLGAKIIGQTLFSENDRFVIRHLDIRSDGKLQPEHIREYAHIEEGMNLFAVDLDQVRDDLASIPIVHSVSVRRKLPDTLDISVSERIPAARLGEESTGYPLAVDRCGFVLGPTSISQQLPSITGLQEKGLRPGAQLGDPGVKSALHVVDLCDLPSFSRFLKIKNVDVSHSEYLEVRLLRGERILLSRENMDMKLTKLCEIMKHTADMGRAIAAIDMTVEKNFPVQYQ